MVNGYRISRKIGSTKRVRYRAQRLFSEKKWSVCNKPGYIYVCGYSSSLDRSGVMFSPDIYFIANAFSFHIYREHNIFRVWYGMHGYIYVLGEWGAGSGCYSCCWL